MRISLVTPARPDSRSGNRTTAARWAKILHSLGHHVDVEVDYSGADVDLMVALHAWRSADSIKRFRQEHHNRPLIVTLTGTDAYQFIHSHRETTLHSIELADQLIGLHALIGNILPGEYRHKLKVIYQSAKSINNRQPVKRSFRICVAGHPRQDPRAPGRR